MEEKKPTALAVGSFRIDKTDYADTAEKLMKRLSKETGGKDSKPFNGLTTTKLRRIYGYIMNIYTKINERSDFEAHLGDIQYLKVRMAYESGREESVKGFLKETHLMTLVDQVGSYDEFMLYCRYAESLVAYFKFFGGKDRE